MKRKKLFLLLSAEAVACILLQFLPPNGAAGYYQLFAFPFAQIGVLLRQLSLAGNAGDATAWALYIGMSLLPVAYLVYRHKKERATLVDALLVLLSVLLFAALYMMINPFMLRNIVPAAELMDQGMIFLGASIYCVLISYAILRALRLFQKVDTPRMFSYLRTLLCVLCAVLVLSIFGIGLSSLLQALRSFRETNTMGNPLGVSYAFLVLQYFVKELPAVFSIAILFQSFSLIDALCEGIYSDNAVQEAVKLSKLCKAAVVAMMLSQIGINIAQLLFGKVVFNSSYVLTIPLMSIAFVLMALLFAKFIEQGKQIKDDNELFV